jgi:hypothetical protein
MNFADILKLGAPGALGILVAIAAIVWIGPSNYGAMIIIVAASVSVAYLLISLLKLLFARGSAAK